MTSVTQEAGQKTGRITQVIGSTFDVEFPEDQLPPIYNAVVLHSWTLRARLICQLKLVLLLPMHLPVAQKNMVLA